MSLSCGRDDFQHQNLVFILSSPYASAGAFSVTPENFEKAMVLHAVKRIPKATWTNDRDAFYAPSSELSDELVSDCVIWSAFAPSNNTVSLKDVPYKGQTYRIKNNLYPFLLDEVREWGCALPDLAAQLLTANDDRFLATWLKGRGLSAEARAVVDAARALYRKFYAEILETNWVDYQVRTWDLGLYQVTQSIKGTDVAAEEFAALRAAHEALRAKLLPQVYSLGFLNPDVAYFK